MTPWVVAAVTVETALPPVGVTLAITEVVRAVIPLTIGVAEIVADVTTPTGVVVSVAIADTLLGAPSDVMTLLVMTGVEVRPPSRSASVVGIKPPT